MDREYPGSENKRGLSVEFVEGLNFGRVLASNAVEGKVVINPATGLKESHGAFDLGGEYSRGEIAIHGIPGKRFRVSLPQKVVLTARGAMATVLSDFSTYPSSTGILGPDGKAVIYLGATLTLKPNQQGSNSAGKINVYVDYVN